MNRDANRDELRRDATFNDRRLGYFIMLVTPLSKLLWSCGSLCFDSVFMMKYGKV